jgi:AAA15 family ATPase/GTPase
LAGLLEMARVEPNLFAVDEIDASLHPDLVIHYLLMFMENVKQSQLIVTTHNREILDDKNLFRNDAIWFTNKNEDGAAELYSLDDFDSAVIRNTSNILNAYKSGKLKAIPKTKDFYL